jgi:hypothetical protein
VQEQGYNRRVILVSGPDGSVPFDRYQFLLVLEVFCHLHFDFRWHEIHAEVGCGNPSFPQEVVITVPVEDELALGPEIWTGVVRQYVQDDRTAITAVQPKISMLQWVDHILAGWKFLLLYPECKRNFGDQRVVGLRLRDTPPKVARINPNTTHINSWFFIGLLSAGVTGFTGESLRPCAG